MKTASIKRGSLVETLIPIKEYALTHPVGSQGQVTRIFRKKNQAAVKFKDGYGSIVSVASIKSVSQTNRKVPKVGDLFCASWGYGQTNIDFYQVTNVISKDTVEVCKCAGTQVNYANMNGHVKADKGNLQGEAKKHRVLYDMEGNPSFKVASYARAFVTDENAEHFFSDWN